MPLLSYTITADLLARPCGHQGNNCPHYQAAIEGIKAAGWADAWFGTSNVRLYDEPITRRDWAYNLIRPLAIVPLPEDVYSWINEYDGWTKDPPEPASFSYEIPPGPLAKTIEEGSNAS
jgi:hypothetical protein